MICVQSYAAILAGFCSHGLPSARAHMHARVLSKLHGNDCKVVTTIMHKVNATGSDHNGHSIGC